MSTEQDRCAKAKRFQRISDAFRQGNLEALYTAVDDPGLVPNGQIPDGIGSPLIYAIYHSPLPFIRRLLEIGADPNLPVSDGFPPLVAALHHAQDVEGTVKRTDVHEILPLLLRFGADPNQRGINDCTPLHIAVGAQDHLAIQLLLEAGADPELPTRIDDCETPCQMAQRAGLGEIEAMLARRGKPQRRRLRSGLTLLVDIPGNGEPVRRHHNYRIRLRMWLNGGEPVRWSALSPACGEILDDDGETLTTEIRINRRSLVNGLFYGVDGMRIGGRRRLEIAPHLAYGNRGVPAVIPPNAVLTAEITIVAAASVMLTGSPAMRGGKPSSQD